MCDGCNIAKKEEKRLPLISSAFLVLTERCNLRCSYCWVNQNPREMSFQVAMDSVHFLIKNSEEENVVPSVTFFGGEPLLRWNDIIVPIVDYVRKVYKKPFRLGVTSNCLLLTEEKLQFLKDNDVALLFSIDGDRKTQNLNRPLPNGEGSFEKLEPIIPIVPKYFPNITFRSTISEETVHLLHHNVMFAFSQGYKRVFAIPNVFKDWTKESKDVLRTQIKLIGDAFIESYRQGEIFAYTNLEEKIQSILHINQIVRGERRKTITKCGLGMTKSASISPTGVLVGCQELSSYEDDTFVIGDIYNGEDLEKRLHLMGKFNVSKVVGTNCKTCQFSPVCNGGCVANNYLINKDLNKMPPLLCFWNQVLIHEAIRITTILGNEENELFRRTYFTGSPARKCLDE